MNKTIVIEKINENNDDQRIDNYLFRRFRKVPKSHIYRLLRSGQVRVNGKRVNFHYRLCTGDLLRIPPINETLTHDTRQQNSPPLNHFTFDFIFEDDALLVVNKPSGLAVHGGSGISFGVIEHLRRQRPQSKFLELVHRLDRETSGVLLLAKKRSALIALHQQLRSGSTEKHYQVLVKGQWLNQKQNVKLPLVKYLTANGERRVTVANGKAQPAHSGSKTMTAHTVFSLIKRWKHFSLLNAELKTGRTHQIRTHLAHLGYPIIGDDKYGDFALNKQLAKNRGNAISPPRLNRMFLHASRMQIQHPQSGKPLKLIAPLPDELQSFITGLDKTTLNSP